MPCCARSGIRGLRACWACCNWQMKLFSPGHERSFQIDIHDSASVFFDGKLTVVARCVRSTSGWFVQTKDGETSLNGGQSIWSTWGSQKSRFCMVLWYPLHLAASSICHRRRMDAVQSFLICQCIFFVVHSLLKCSNKLKINFFVYLSVFRGGKREFSSIAGVDSPYHSLQVAAVTRLFVS